ncbi:MAG: class I SAM-dependent methyltransferase, partial [Anaerolineae bacterium]
LETVTLRQHAAAKFSRAAAMFFTRPALEQASGEAVAAYRARRFARLGAEWVADLGCGIGGDALALAAHAQVIGIDRDEVRLGMAQANVSAYGCDGRFHPVQADLTDLPPLPVDALFFDPARRDTHGRRLFSVSDYRPPLSLIDGWRQRVPHTAVKISPGVDYAELPPDAEVEFISMKGEVKEAVLWFGGLGSAVARRATLLPGGNTLTTNDLPEGETAVTPPQSFLYEPDKAIIRAHLVEALAARLNAAKISPDIAYLTGETAVAAPFARCFLIESVMPFQLKRLRQHLRQNRIGQVIIKKRGSPLQPDQLRQQLRLKGDKQRILFLTQVMGEAAVIITHPPIPSP